MSAAVPLEIAGLRVAVACEQPPLHAALERRYAAFRGEGAPHFHLRVRAEPQPLRAHAQLDVGLRWQPQGARFEAPGFRGHMDLRAGEGALAVASKAPLEEVEYYLRILYALLAFRAGGALFHAAGVVRAGAAYLFFGPSGAGKTTAASLSRRGQVLNDDLLLLMPSPRGWLAHATPFWNPTQVQPRRGRAPVRALLRLVQAPRVALQPLSGGRALAECMACFPVLTTHPRYAAELFRRAQSLLSAVPAYWLHFRKDDSFWSVLETLA